MKYFLISLMLFTIIQSSNLDEEKDYDLVDEQHEETEDGQSPHLIPDINCLVNNYHELFGFPEKEVNGRISPQPINHQIDPLIMYLNITLEDKQEEQDNFIEINDIDLYFRLDGDMNSELRQIINECALIPRKFSLFITQLNYLYCAIVWKNGFEVFGNNITENEDYKNGFFKIVNNTVSKIFDYKTYIRDLKINKYTMKFWNKFYENLLEFNDLNVNFINYDKTTIVKIKEKNYFFNEDEYKQKNLFFRFYKNYESILRALNKSFFYFDVHGDYILSKVKTVCYMFENIIVKEVYGSIFYLFMKSDQKFLDTLYDELQSKNFLITETLEDLDIFNQEFKDYMEELIKKGEEFNLSDVLQGEEEEAPRELPSTNPLFNYEIKNYTVPPKPKQNLKKQQEEFGNEIQKLNQIAQKEKIEQKKFRKFLKTKARMFNNNFNSQKFIKKDTGRILQESNQKHIIKKNEKDFFNALYQVEHPKHNQKDNKQIRKLFELPVRPNMDDPNDFFDRMDFLKEPLSDNVKRMTLTEFFQKYETKTKDNYGQMANIQLINLCKQHMVTRIEALSNIFCMILQRESSLLLQQKYNNSKVKAFFNKYFKFITYNFFTYFMVLEDKGDLIEIEALTLFFNEKFFSAIKLAIVSFNNLLLHFEDEYREFYLEKIRDYFMPYLNRFKKELLHTIMMYRDHLTETILDNYEINEEKLRLSFLPTFRKSFEELIIQPSLETMNLDSLKEQYQNYVFGMNLLSYNKIQQNFYYFSQSTGIQKSSEPPSQKCQELHVSDINKAHDQMQSLKKKTVKNDNDEIPDEEECVKNWKLYDDVFHYVFYNTDTQKIIIKKKTDVDSPVQKRIIQNAIENELVRVVNGFIPSRMKEKLDYFNGETQAGLETCGILLESSMIKCESIFGLNNCKRIPDTIYYSRKCPKGYKRDGIACVFNCEPYGLREENEFCVKSPENSSIPCPEETIEQGQFKCLKPMKKYFVYIMNPFNNLLQLISQYYFVIYILLIYISAYLYFITYQAVFILTNLITENYKQIYLQQKKSNQKFDFIINQILKNKKIQIYKILNQLQ